MKTIWVNGCFDVLHIGHILLFEFAKSLGDKLIVGIDSDKRVKFLKGESRPINNEKNRLKFLKSIKYIDEIVIFNSEDDLKENIKKNKINTIVVGSDYKNKTVIGSEFCERILFFERIKDYSTTKILETIKEKNG